MGVLIQAVKGALWRGCDGRWTGEGRRCGGRCGLRRHRRAGEVSAFVAPPRGLRGVGGPIRRGVPPCTEPYWKRRRKSMAAEKVSDSSMEKAT